MRRFVLAALPLFLFGLAVVAVAFPGQLNAFVTTKSAVTAPAPHAAPPKVAVFNMIGVMKEFKKARYKVWVLGEDKKRLQNEVGDLKSEYAKIQKDVQSETDAAKKEEMQERMIELSRSIEDKNRRIQKKLDEHATVIIGELYDEIKEVVDTIAEANGCTIIFAYPDAATPEEAKSPYMKELKLKPPAAFPFYVAKRCDYTEQVVKELNKRYPAPEVPEPDATLPRARD